MRKLVGTLLIIGGIACIGYGINMNNQMTMQQMQIAHAEEAEENPRPLRPMRDYMAEQSNQTMNDRIDSALQRIGNSEEIVVSVEIAGVILIALGLRTIFRRK